MAGGSEVVVVPDVVGVEDPVVDAPPVVAAGDVDPFGQWATSTQVTTPIVAASRTATVRRRATRLER